MIFNALFIFIYKVLVCLFSFWLYLCYLKEYIYHCTCDEYDAIDHKYDYIVVGAGTAGFTVAMRLAERTRNTVLLIEAGDETSFPFNIPVLAPLLQQSYFDWQYQTVPQDNACLGLKEQRSNWPMGRAVGGTSLLNNMIYVRGHRWDYDAWSAADNPTWGYNEDARVLFRRSEKQRGRYKNHSLYHGWSGLWPVTDLPFSTDWSAAVLDGSMELSYNVSDLNAGIQAGFMQPQVNFVRGSRFSVNQRLDKYMHINKRLRLLSKAVVEKVLFTPNNRAVGVQYHRLGTMKKVRCRKTVVLCAGTIGTPRILMLSGLGPKQHLTELGIPVRGDLPVGRNLQDHVTTGLDLVLLNQSLTLSLGAFLSPLSALQYFWNGQGPWTFPGCDAIGLVHSRYSNPAVDPPDLQLLALPAGISADGGVVLRRNMGISDQIWNAYFAPLVGHHVVSLLPVLLHPESRGEVTLRSRRHDDKPIINPRYLSAMKDVAVLYEGILLVKKLIATPALQKLGARLYERPLPGCEQHTFDTASYWECYIRHLTVTSYHPVGTCKMGPKRDPSSVVDAHLRVHGTYALRVADASVIPALPSANINAAVIMIAEKVVDMMLTYWSDKQVVPLTVGRCYARDVFLLPGKHRK